MPVKLPVTDDSSATFSQHIRAWLDLKDHKTLGSMLEAFGEKSYALFFLVLMAVPALPIPTGGITHVFEIICMLIALEMIVGLKTLWLPKWARAKPLGDTLTTKGLPKLVTFMTRAERFSRPRLRGVLSNTFFLRLTGIYVFALTASAFFAPPFTGLDTLPALGIVSIAFGLLVGDFVFYAIGLVIGTIGVGLIIGLSSALFKVIFG